MTSVLLATFASMPDGEPGHAALDEALQERGVTARWACWDDPAVAWADADVVAVRSTWDYDGRYAEFLGWVRRIESDGARVLNGADVFAWNGDKAYLVGLGESGLPVVPTIAVDGEEELPPAIAEFGTAVVKPRTGASGRGVVVFDMTDGGPPDLDESQLWAGPWVVQPLVESVRTEGESSVFVIDGAPVSQVDKLPAGGEIRVHEHYGGSSRPVELSDEHAGLAVAAMAAAGTALDRELPYGRVDMMRLADGTLAVSELELIEPGLYLDVLPANAAPFADMVVRTAGS